MESQQNMNSGTEEESKGATPGQETGGSSDIAREETDPRWRLSASDEIIFYGLIMLSLIGAVILQVSVSFGRTYWLTMIPIIAVATIYVEWAKVRNEEVKWTTLIRMQILHWGSLVIAVQLVSLLSNFGRVNNTAVSSMTLLLLAQTTFLVGVHRDWRFCVVAVFQVLCLIVLTYLQTYIWLMLVVAVAIIALGVYFHRKFPQLSPVHRH